ncbi:hypothetical protein [Mycobacterium sp. AZCC_0083]|uniref:hypothetical protein n=1 Tax=Mycobacterium sp. AZCC_0083 TaxID=2735882 RepID=UPI00160CDE7E|nr:hypothetical protein [Mycobacterium sp. AZCC_0083]MBB5167159.1 hypothetical protein [Mycobacterium sp. AZCC_0083]
MAYPNSGVPVPAMIAEAAYAALSYAHKYLTDHNGHMPPDMVEKLGKVAFAYNRDRTASLVYRGIPPVVVEKFSETAADKLAEWMGKRQTILSDGDFERWAEELGSGEDTA